MFRFVNSLILLVIDTEDSRIALLWITMMLCIFWYNFWSVLFRISFVRTRLDNAAIQSVFTIVDVVTDVISIVDLVFNFFRHYPGSDGIFVVDKKRTAKHYLKTFFIYDLVACFVVDWIFIGWLPLVVVCIRFTRLIRIMKMTTYFKELQTNLAILGSATIKVLKYISYALLIIHMLTCGWYLVIEAEDEALVYLWTGRYRLIHDHTMSIYLFGFNWCLVTMTGYGGTVPASFLQIMYAEIVVLLGTCIYVIVIGTVSSLVTSNNSNEAKSKQKMEEMEQYMKFRKLPSELQAKIRDYFEFLWKSRKGWDEKQILQDLPQYLRMEIALDINRDLIEKVPIFKDRSKMFISQVVMSLIPRVTLPGSIICRKGDIGREMYFISNGSVQVISEDVPPKVFVTLGPGTFFGEISVVIANQKRNATVRAATFCDLYVLTKDSFDMIEHDYPTEVESIRELARKRIEETNKAAQK